MYALCATISLLTDIGAQTAVTRYTMNIKNPYYDPLTDTIHNCVEGSFVWYHELRHQIQFRYDWVRRWDYKLHQNPILYFIWNQLLEIDANLYAIVKYSAKNKDYIEGWVYVCLILIVCIGSTIASMFLQGYLSTILSLVPLIVAGFLVVNHFYYI